MNETVTTTEPSWLERLRANFKLLPHTATAWVSAIWTAILVPILLSISPAQWETILGFLPLPPLLSGILLAWIVKDLPTWLARVWPQPKLEAKEAAVTDGAAKL